MADIEQQDVVKSVPVVEEIEMWGLDGNGNLARTSTFAARFRYVTGVAVGQSNAIFYGRPGELIGSWTTAINTFPPVPSTIPMNTTYGTSVADGGICVTITGEGYIGPNAVDRLEDDTVIEYVYVLSRLTNNFTIPNGTIPVIEAKFFDGTGAYLSTITYNVPALVVADGVKAFRIAVSRMPGKGTQDIPTQARFCRATIGNRGGVLAVYSLAHRDRLDQLASLIDAGTEITSGISLTAMLAFSDGGVLKKIQWQNLFKELQLMFDPPLYDTWERVDVSTTSHILLGADPDLKKLTWQGAGDASVGVAVTGAHASMSMERPTVIAHDGTSGKIDFGKGGATKPMALVSSIAGPVTICRSRLTQNYTKYKLFGDDMMAYWPRQDVDDRFREAMRNALNLCQANDITGTANSKSKFLYLTGLAEENDTINLFNPEAGKTLTYVRGTTGLVSTPYGWVKGGGTDAYIETGLGATDLNFGTQGHSLLCRVESTDLDPDGIQVSISGNYYLTSNLTNTYGGSRTGSGRDNLDSAPGKMIGFNRNNPDTYTQFVEGELIKTVTRPTSAMPSGTLKLCASPTAGGVTAVSKLPIGFAVVGDGYNTPVNSFRAMYQAFMPVLNIRNTIRAELAAA